MCDDQRRWVLSEDGTEYVLDPSQVNEYIAALKVQVDEWLKGNNVHNTFSDECVPDMSCCGLPEWTLAHKHEFLNADDATQINILMGCLVTELIEKCLPNAHVLVETEIEPTLH